MPTVLDSLSLRTVTPANVSSLSVVEYHQLIAAGYLTDDDPFELLEGWIVTRKRKTPAHCSAGRKLLELVPAMLLPEWDWRVHAPVTLAFSEPEPDISIIRPDAEKYWKRHPGPADVGLLLEVADSSLDTDRIDKLGIYARENIPVYWIVNLIDRQIEVYERPLGTDYQSRRAYRPGENVPIVLAGQTVGHIAVDAVLPRA